WRGNVVSAVYLATRRAGQLPLLCWLASVHLRLEAKASETGTRIEREMPPVVERTLLSRQNVAASAIRSQGLTGWSGWRFAMDAKIIGLIGAGHIGSQLARLAVAHGYDVVVSNSRGPETLQGLVDELGPHAHATTPSEAAERGDIVVVTIPLKNIGQV